MIRIVTNCTSSSTILRSAANYTVAGTLAAAALWWDFGVPQAIYDRDHPHIKILPGVHYQTPYFPPERESYVSSDHALLIGRTVKT